jgi:uncharacterized membrane protein YhaH (DUF805 family)
MKAIVRQAILPLRLFAEFRGRSRRTELLAFWVLVTIVHGGLPTLMPFSVRAEAVFGFIVAAVILIPAAALCVRRVHDVGWSGWWLAPLLPLAAFGLWNDAQRIQAPYDVPPKPPLTIGIIVGIFLVSAMVLLVWDDEHGTNRFGPNPRYSDDDQGAETIVD